MIEIKKPSIRDINLVLFDDEIFDRISDDNTRKEGLLFPYQDWDWYGGYINNNIIGLFYIHDDNWMHFAVLKQYRKYASKFLKKCLKEYNKSVYCLIPTMYKSVINFAKKHGFKENGNGQFKYLKNNVFYDNVKLIYEV